MLVHCDAYIKKLGAVIVEYGFSENFGVALLHKHFNLYNDELLLRSVSVNRMEVAPSNKGESEVIGYMWAFAKTHINYSFCLYPVEFLHEQSAPKWAQDAIYTMTKNSEFLLKYFDTLARMGLSNYFGIGLIPRRLFDMEDADTLMESDNLLQRRLYIDVVPQKNLEGIDATQTLWIF